MRSHSVFLEGMQYITESVMSVILETKPETSEFQFRSVQLIVLYQSNLLLTACETKGNVQVSTHVGSIQLFCTENFDDIEPDSCYISHIHYKKSTITNYATFQRVLLVFLNGN